MFLKRVVDTGRAKVSDYVSAPAAWPLLVLLATVPLWASEELQQNLQRIFGTQALASRSFGPTRWIGNGASFTTVEPSAADPNIGEIIEYDTASGKRSLLIGTVQLTPKEAAKALNVEDYWWDRDMHRLLIFTESRRYWRTNSRGDYWVLNRDSSELKKVGGRDAPASSLMYAKFSPDGTQVAFVRASNIYVEDLNSGAIHALTSDGSSLVNGATDWVYEEELNLRDGFRWSPDGLHIAYWQFDESGVEKFTLINDTDSLYPKLTTFPYPKSGTKKPAVRVGVIPTSGGSTQWIAIPGESRDNYLFRMDWIDGERLGIGQLNRRQNLATIYVSDIVGGSPKAVYKDEDQAWVDLPESEGTARPGESFLWIREHKAFLWLSEHDGWRRAWAVPFDGSNAPSAVTPAGVDVSQVAGTDPESRWLYYIASPDNATERYLYRSPIDHTGPAERLSPSDPGTHRYNLYPDCRWAIHSYSTFDNPPTLDLVRLPGQQSVRMLERNLTLRANASSLLDPPVEFLKVKVSDGALLDGWLLRPRNFDPAKKYPVIVYVYGEPAGVTVTNEWQRQSGLFH